MLLVNLQVWFLTHISWSYESLPYLLNARRMPLCHILHWKKLISNTSTKFWSESANYISLDPIIHMLSKRKSGLEAEKCSKKSKLQEISSSLSKSVDELLSDDITVGLKRRLRLDETSPAKKIKQVEYSSGEWQLRKLSANKKFIFINKLQRILKSERFLVPALDFQSMEQKHSSQLDSLAASSTGTQSVHGMRRWSPPFHAKEFCDGRQSILQTGIVLSQLTSHGKQNSRSVIRFTWNNSQSYGDELTWLKNLVN